MSVETMIQDLVQQIGQMTVSDLNKLVKALISYLDKAYVNIPKL